jgi:hypothetical protein
MDESQRGGAIIAAIFLANLGALLIWFLFSSLRRNWEDALRELETFLHLVDGAEPKTERRPWAESLAELRAMVERGRGLGPIWGRRPLVLARVLMVGMAERWPVPAGEAVTRLLGR